jgi:hypothetical protein
MFEMTPRPAQDFSLPQAAIGLLATRPMPMDRLAECSCRFSFGQKGAEPACIVQFAPNFPLQRICATP